MSNPAIPAPVAPQCSAAELIGQASELQTAGDAPAALALYLAWLQERMQAGQPQSLQCAVIWFNTGVLHAQLGAREQAIEAYRHALSIHPGLACARVNLGLSLEALGQEAQALATWQAGVLASKDECLLLNQLGRLHEKQKNHRAAEEALRRSLALDPQQAACVQHWIYLRAKQCSWPVNEPIMGLDGKVRSVASLNADMGPFSAMALSDDPQALLVINRRWLSEHGHDKVKPMRWAATVPPQGRRLRVGYLSGDFRQHAVGMVSAPMLEAHDRSRCEVFALDYTQPGHEGSERGRILKAVEHHLALQDLGDAQAVARIAALDLDVLVDLTGLTAGARIRIVAAKPARRVVNYLGYIGSVGLEAVDYGLTDVFATTPELARHFAEKPLFHPTCFQVNAPRHSLPVPSRASQGLPEGVFIYSVFSNAYKINPPVFARWMEILRQTPDSVLWLLADNPPQRANLLCETEAAGIDPTRLFFADRVAPQHYFARFGCADLMLDTAPYGAGLTASDALWMGLPIVTLPGQTFTSRMAGSLLKAVGLPETITSSHKDYVSLAVELGKNPERAARMKQQLLTRGRSGDLFDTRKWVRQWEDMMLELVASDGK